MKKEIKYNIFLISNDKNQFQEIPPLSLRLSADIYLESYNWGRYSRYGKIFLSI